MNNETAVIAANHGLVPGCLVLSLLASHFSLPPCLSASRARRSYRCTSLPMLSLSALATILSPSRFNEIRVRPVF